MKLTKDSVLALVSPLEIFEAFMPHSFDLNTATNSPFRKDRNPSFNIGYKGGQYFYIDYSTGERGDCFDFVKNMTFATTFPEILEQVVKQMGLKPGDASNTTKPKRKYEEEVEEEKLIQIKIRTFTKTDLDWWAKFGLSGLDLKKQKDVKVYSVDRYWVNKELRFYNISDELCFAYHFEPIDKFKIYRPLADKKKGESKWISNVPLKTMYGLDNIKNCEKAIIAKSFKDLAVLNKIYPCVAGTQNETLAAISDENLEFIRSNAKESYIAFDSDEPGKKASWSITKELGLKHLNTPDALLKFGVNDFAGWAERDGIDMVQYFLKLKGFI